MIDVTPRISAEAGRATVVYAIGDIHGRLDLLDKMEAAIAADISVTRPAQPLICYLGDYVDRGPHSAQVLDRLCMAGGDGVDRVFLKGNHEDRMIDFLVAPAKNGPAWMKFGSREALESYGLTAPENIDDADWVGLRDSFDAALPESHRAFLDTLAISFRWDEYLLVHAGLDPERPATAQTAHDLMWIREPFLSSECDWGFTVVHGHVIVDEPVFHTNRIGIDTGAYQSGCLTCLVITQGGTRIMQVAQQAEDHLREGRMPH
jgi:serine/threonine protein phosphatase 1